MTTGRGIQSRDGHPNRRAASVLESTDSKGREGGALLGRGKSLMGGPSGTRSSSRCRSCLPLLSYRRKSRGFLRSKRRVNISSARELSGVCLFIFFSLLQKQINKANTSIVGGGGQTHVSGLEKIRDAQVKIENMGRQEILSLK